MLTVNPRRSRPCRRLIQPGLLVCLAVLLSGLAAASAIAANLAPPSLTAWQRAHEGHLTITWTETIRVAQKRVGDRLILRFSEPLGIEAAAALANLSNVIDPSRSTVDGGDLSLALKPGVSSKVGLREKRIVTVDLVHDAGRRPASEIDVSAIKDGVRLTLDWPGPTRVQSSNRLSELHLTLSPARTIDPERLADLRQSLKPWFRELQLSAGGDVTTLSFLLEPHIASSVRAFGPSTTIVDLIRDASTGLSPAAGPTDHIFIPRRRPVPATTTAGTLVDAGPPIPEKRPSRTQQDRNVATADQGAANRADAHAGHPDALTIAWDEPVGAAIFIRAGHLWAVFDQPDAGLLSALPTSPPAFGPASIVPADGGTALRFALNDPVDIEVERTAENRWQITPSPSASSPKPHEINMINGSTALRLSPISSGAMVSITDPTVGDRIGVLPHRDPGIGQPTRQRFVDLELLPTAQGLVWRPLNDQLAVKIENEGLIISSPEGLSLSSFDEATPSSKVIAAVADSDLRDKSTPETSEERPAIYPDELSAPQSSDEAVPSSYLNLADSAVDRALVGEYRRIRRQAITRAAPEQKDQARLNLARLLVAERLATEARTVLRTINDDADKDIVLQKQALSGAAAFLIGHLSDASSMLLDPELSEDDEIGIWRAALDAAENQWQAAAEGWRNAGDSLDSYPPKLMLDLGLMALRSAIETDDDEMMQQGLERLTSLQLDPYDQARLDLMKAMKAEREGNVERAQALLTDLKNNPNQVIRTIADFELAALDLDRTGDSAEPLAALYRLIPAWRGHPDEKTMLDKLARRYRDIDALRRALMIWRRLIRLYPETAENEELIAARREAFIRALVDTNEPAIALYDAYAIYLDFRDLLPGDPGARKVHQHLAQHLIDLDLLDQAINVLKPLMTSATDQTERAKMALTIATLMLRLERPAPALAMLDETGKYSELPAALEQERRVISAKALAKLGKTEEALRQLRDILTPSAKRLQADILWDEQRWPRLSAVIDSYLAGTDLTSPLAKEDQEMVLRLAVARQREGQVEKLKTLREKFGAAMRDSDYASAFDVATQSEIRADDIETLLAATENQLVELNRFRNRSAAIP